MRVRSAVVAVPIAAAVLLGTALTVDVPNPRPAHAQECPTTPQSLIALGAALEEQGLAVRVDVLPGSLNLSIALPPGATPPPFSPAECPTVTVTSAEPEAPSPSTGSSPPTGAAPSATPVGPQSVT